MKTVFVSLELTFEQVASLSQQLRNATDWSSKSDTYGGEQLKNYAQSIDREAETASTTMPAPDAAFGGRILSRKEIYRNRPSDREIAMKTLHQLASQLNMTFDGVVEKIKEQF